MKKITTLLALSLVSVTLLLADTAEGVAAGQQNGRGGQ